jgi:transcriptional regulator with XRE-family HTH domain
MSEIGAYLKEIREKRKLTLRKVQELTGVSNAYLSQVETGKIKKPSPKVLHKLADCFKIQYERLLKLTGYPAPENNMAQPQYRTGDWIEDVTPEEEERLKEYLEFLRTRKG